MTQLEKLQTEQQQALLKGVIQSSNSYLGDENALNDLIEESEDGSIKLVDGFAEKYKSKFDTKWQTRATKYQEEKDNQHKKGVKDTAKKFTAKIAELNPSFKRSEDTKDDTIYLEQAFNDAVQGYRATVKTLEDKVTLLETKLAAAEKGDSVNLDELTEAQIKALKNYDSIEKNLKSTYQKDIDALKEENEKLKLENSSIEMRVNVSNDFNNEFDGFDATIKSNKVSYNILKKQALKLTLDNYDFKVNPDETLKPIYKFGDKVGERVEDESGNPLTFKQIVKKAFDTVGLVETTTKNPTQTLNHQTSDKGQDTKITQSDLEAKEKEIRADKALSVQQRKDKIRKLHIDNGLL